MNQEGYNQIAEMIKLQYASETYAGRRAVSGIMFDLADMFAEHDSEFDRVRFYRACGVKDYPQGYMRT